MQRYENIGRKGDESYTQNVNKYPLKSAGEVYINAVVPKLADVC